MIEKDENSKTPLIKVQEMDCAWHAVGATSSSFLFFCSSYADPVRSAGCSFLPFPFRSLPLPPRKKERKGKGNGAEKNIHDVTCSLLLVETIALLKIMNNMYVVLP